MPYTKAKRSGRSVIFDTDGGTQIVRQGGDQNQRNFNPGNIIWGPYARDHGAIGRGGPFAIFPDYDTGRQALKDLLTGPTYRDSSMEDVFRKYAPESDQNDPTGYAKFVERQTGIPKDRLIKDFSPDEIDRMMNAIERMEGRSQPDVMPIPKEKPQDIPSAPPPTPEPPPQAGDHPADSLLPTTRPTVPRSAIDDLLDGLKWDDVSRDADPAQHAMFKEPHLWTEQERDDVLEGYQRRAPGDPHRDRMRDAVETWFRHHFPDPVQWDATGKMIPPRPKGPLPGEPVPIRTTDGHSMETAFERLSGHVGTVARDDAAPDVVRGLQSGLNLLDDAALKEDGDFGPRTRYALAQTMVRRGPGKAEEALAFGRLTGFARQAAGQGRADGLEEMTERTAAALYPAHRLAEARPMVAATLQETVNEFANEDDGLKVDGWIGPKTTAGFARAVRAAGPEEFTRRFASKLGLW